MVQPVNVPVEGPPVDQAVDRVEMRLAPHGDEKQERGAIDRVRGPIDDREISVRLPPERGDLERRPHWNGAHKGPEDVVENLIVKQKVLAVLG